MRASRTVLSVRLLQILMSLRVLPPIGADLRYADDIRPTDFVDYR